MYTTQLSSAVTSITRSGFAIRRLLFPILWSTQTPSTTISGSPIPSRPIRWQHSSSIASSVQKLIRKTDDSVKLQSSQTEFLSEISMSEEEEIEKEGKNEIVQNTRRRPTSRRKKKRQTPLRTLTLPSIGLTSAQLAALANVSTNTVLRCAKQLDSSVHDQSSVLSSAVVELVTEELGLRVGFNAQTVPLRSGGAKAIVNVTTRAPVITVMGHVDHGKTSLLDALRDTDVAKNEAGGITQSVAAFRVPIGLDDENSTYATFIDTPGHAAFSAMRANGAVATDIIVLVVAGDDGVKPQTIEAAQLARTCNTAVIVAINKCDKASADPDRVRYELLQDANINTETLGGTVQSVEISAKTGKGLPELLEAILIQAEMLELKCNDSEAGTGICLESRLDRSLGNVATVVVRSGKIRKGDFVAFHSGLLLQGEPYGRVKLLLTSDGERVSEAGPGTAIGIIGVKETIPPGCEVAVMQNERVARAKAREIVAKNVEAVGTIELANRLVAEREERAQHAEDTKAGESNERCKEGIVNSTGDDKSTAKGRQVVLVVKADVKGSADAVAQCVQRLSDEKVGLRVVRMGVGEVTDADVVTASVGKKVKGSRDECMIIAFNVRVKDSTRKAARSAGVRVVQHEIIYHLEDEVRCVVDGIRDEMMPKENIVGKADVMRVFDSGSIGGCRIGDGTVTIGDTVKVMRFPDDLEQDRIRQEVFRGEVASIKQFAKAIKCVNKGSECGIGIKDWRSFKNGDQILAINMTGGG